MGAVVGGFCRQRKHICGGLCFNLGKMGKSESSGGASTYIYGLIFLLYAGIAVVLFIYMMNKRSKQQKVSETENLEFKANKGNPSSASSPSSATSHPSQERKQPT